MYLDSLTISALVVFAIFFGVVLKYCIFNICGMPGWVFETDRDASEKQRRR
jgi:hypothetical protein